jgi:uncharacterized protein (DUF1800 family)
MEQVMALDNATMRVVAETRFGTGVSSNERRLDVQDWREFLSVQIDQGDLSAEPGGLVASPAEAVRTFQDTRAQRRANALAEANAKMQPPDGMAERAGRAPEADLTDVLPHRVVFEREAQGRVIRMIQSPSSLFERMANFWSNHFCVSRKKGVVRTLVGVYEREAIRPHVYGRFADMLLAVAKHPAMLKYLDNNKSIGPNSEAGRRRGAGLNENLARELLELHTLGVHGGYGQTDVTALARILTGWAYVSVDIGEGELGDFAFNPRRHEPGAQVVLGKTYAEAGIEQGEAALRDLAAHPATASHLALKLSRHFVGDDPPPQVVARLRQTFLSTDGDLRAVAKALISSDEAWEAPRAKLLPPLDFIVSALKIFGAVPGPHLVQMLSRSMGQPIWEPSSPNGFPDDNASWLSPESIKSRVDAALNIAARYQVAERPTQLAELAFGPVLSLETRKTIAAAESSRQGLALLLMSPEFQRR